MKSKILCLVILMLLGGCAFGQNTQERAISLGDHTICDSASHPDTCKLAVAKSKNDISVCNDIQDKIKKKTCQARVDKPGIDCGREGKPCCKIENKEICLGSAKCVNDICVACSRRGGDCNTLPCCEDLECSEGVCITDGCGYLNEPCCEGKCFGDHICKDGTCRWEKEAQETHEPDLSPITTNDTGYSSVIGSRG